MTRLESKRLKILKIGRGKVESALLVIDRRKASELNCVADGIRR